MRLGNDTILKKIIPVWKEARPNFSAHTGQQIPNFITSSQNHDFMH